MKLPHLVTLCTGFIWFASGSTGLADRKIRAGELRAGGEKGRLEKPSAGFPYRHMFLSVAHFNKLIQT
jgi:hypothetical protein